ncbi:MAG: chemotaxis protein CheA [Candidatus Riflebacteria bacterium]|nr:chemotaxis protein CheA [Candidatus Riflebacteria bacterium]
MKKIDFEAVFRTGLDKKELEDLLRLIAGEDCQIHLAQEEDVDSESGLTADTVQPIGEILIKRGDITSEDLDKGLKKHKPLGQELVEDGVVSPDSVKAALEEQARQRDAVARRSKVEKISTIRVASEKLDKLFNLIGELVTVQERLSQVSGKIRKAQPEDLDKVLQELDLEGISEEVSLLTNSLRDNALSVRMLPVESTFTKFRRLIHDLSTDLNKEIDLTMSGTDTEIDKTVIDKLDEPLMHMIRNCADHGIETPDERLAAGKPRRGTIHLSAEHVSGNVVIHVRDDGAGLNKEKILQRAIEREVVAPNVQLSDQEIFKLIFMPGFSTAAEVTSVSGRGVGMDVVKKTIEELRGSVEVFSTPGKGTQIDVVLPLTLAIIDGLLVSIDNCAFVIPLSVVEECIELISEQSKNNTTGGNLANVRGSLVPYIRLRELFKIEGQAPAIEQIVISRVNGQRVGFVVDTVIGEHKTVIKSLGKTYHDVPEFSGASIMGDGSIAIILDAARLIQTSILNEVSE